VLALALWIWQQRARTSPNEPCHGRDVISVT
jgi:hypothetical protein